LRPPPRSRLRRSRLFLDLHVTPQVRGANPERVLAESPAWSPVPTMAGRSLGA